jgi:signal transduction histidine kinase/CheY-like chemotaxis protein
LNVPSLSERADRARRGLGLVAAGLGGASLVGSGLGLGYPALVSARLGVISPVTALALLAAGIGIGWLPAGGARHAPGAARAAGLGLILLAALGPLSEAAPDLGIVPMAPGTAIALAAVGAGLAATGARSRWLRMLGRIGPEAGVGIALVVIVGYVYDERYLLRPGDGRAMGLLSALGVVALGLAAGLARPAHGLIRGWMFPTETSAPLRRLIPAALAAPILLGALALRGLHAGWYGESLAFALVTVFTGATLLGLILVGARRLDDLHREREQLLRDALAARGAAERASRAKDELLSLVSHELRSPLHTMGAWLAALRGMPDGPPRERALGALERSLRLLTRLIGDLLDASRIATGKLEIERAAVDLRAVVESAVRAFEPIARERGIALEAALAPASAPIRGDAERAEQIAHNLIGNALKFTPTGGHVRVELESAGGEHRLVVRDSGRGIDAADLPLLFERFFQGRERGEGEVGLGLGLAISAHLVEAHGGRIEAASEGAGLGSTFAVYLPASSDAAETPDPSSRSPSGTRGLAGRLVLLVDPDPGASDALVSLLTGAGAEVRPASSPADAWREGEPVPDAIVYTLRSPSPEVGELLRRLRDRRASLLAIAITSGGVTATGRQAFRRLGFGTVLEKPLEPEVLVDRLRRRPTAGLRVLVVEDDADSADSLALLLSRRGCKVVVARSAREATRRADEGFDVVILDVHLPDGDGFQLARSLRESVPPRALRVLALTGDDRVATGPTDSPFDAVLRKPVVLDELLSLL